MVLPAQRDAARGPEAREALIERHLPLVRAVARRHVGRGEELEDLEQVGVVGLIKAVDRFDAGRRVSLGAYAAPCIAGEIKRHLRDRGALIRLPRDADSSNPARFPVPLEDVLELWPDETAARRLELGESRALLAGGLRSLPERERRIVELRYFGGLTQDRIAAELGLSQVHVSRLLRGALLTLRARLDRAVA